MRVDLDHRANSVGDSLSVIRATFEYDAFGKTICESGPDKDKFLFRYSTKYTDLETDLVYYGLRYYSPSVGRFVNRDPIEESGGLNLYGFCGNSGVNFWDLLGLDPITSVQNGNTITTTVNVWFSPLDRNKAVPFLRQAAKGWSEPAGEYNFDLAFEFSTSAQWNPKDSVKLVFSPGPGRSNVYGVDVDQTVITIFEKSLDGGPLQSHLPEHEIGHVLWLKDDYLEIWRSPTGETELLLPNEKIPGYTFTNRTVPSVGLEDSVMADSSKPVSPDLRKRVIGDGLINITGTPQDAKSGSDIKLQHQLLRPRIVGGFTPGAIGGPLVILPTLIVTPNGAHTAPKSQTVGQPAPHTPDGRGGGTIQASNGDDD